MAYGTTIQIDTADGTAEAYLTRPGAAADDSAAGEHRYPGVLFIVDAIGLRPQTRSMADRIASWGYTVLVPNVFYHWGTAAETSPAQPLLDDESRADFFATAMPRVHALTPDVVDPDLVDYLDALQAVAPGKVGAIGYCMGGRLALRAAALRPDTVAAVGLFHTGGLVTDKLDSPHRHLTDVDATLLAIHADNDRSLPPEAVARFEHALIQAGVTHRASVYPGAAHGFTMADTAVYNHEAAEFHFRELRTLLDQCSAIAAFESKK